jgi:hypothetical protein
MFPDEMFQMLTLCALILLTMLVVEVGKKTNTF